MEPPVFAYQHAYLALAAIAALTAVFSFNLPDGPARAAAQGTVASSRSNPLRRKRVDAR
ncbi:hypothetical protein [Streptomyces sp. NPDC047009]|uniref:hypothetical protein n=1 Tax=unclassified Streptomyces TaxID=2593676 RepID=UPI0033D189E9